ncbi:hypothetical protein EDD22DRAFT_213566 [Suillus occidentalis]|nr:hypothetical protein EDD22DRAFT_213566 [Suillus occidentalis]
MTSMQKDQAALRSSPPFPSPGSSFLPPPTPGPHEFARPGNRKQSKKDIEDVTTAANGLNSGQATPNGAVSPQRASLAFFRSFLPRFIISMLNVPRSLFHVISFQESTPTTESPNTSLLDPPPHRLLDSHDTEDHSHRLSTQSVTSLTSSRPAPPSPAISRRESGLSRTSSISRSRPVSDANSRSQRPGSGALSPSAVLSRTPSGRRAKDILGMSAVAENKGKEPETAPTETKVLIKIRDYAFAPSNPQFSGEGPNVPRPNRPKVLARRLRGSSSSTSSLTSTSSTEEEDDQWEDDNDNNGWGGFKWGFQKLQSGWGLGSGSSSSEDFPSRTDFARNFGDGGGDDDDDESEYEEPDEFPENQDDEEMEGEPMLFPGLYRALYSFEPEGTAEMKLDEDQIVRVVGRGGGVGWAVVVKEDTGSHALVPESYLEVVKLDGDEQD